MKRKSFNRISWLSVSFLFFVLFSFSFFNCGGGDKPKPKETAKENPISGGENSKKDAGNTPDNNKKKPDNKPVDTTPIDKNPVDNGSVDNGSVDNGTPDPGTPDPGTPDNGTPDPGTPETQQDGPAPKTGTMFRVNKLTFVLDKTKGFDLNGDGKPDNKMGALFGNQFIKGFIDVQKEINSQVQSERLNLLLSLKQLTDPSGQKGKVTVEVFQGKKTGTPGTYKIDPKSVDSSGKALISFKKSPISKGLTKAGPGDFVMRLTLVPNSPPTELAMKKSLLHFKIESGFSKLTGGRLGGAVPMAVLDTVQLPKGALGGGPVLGMLLGLLPTAVQPDIDLDADKLEKLEKPAQDIICTDGDGKTKIKAPSPCPNGAKKCSCAQAKEIADGLSVYMTFEAVPAKIQK